MEKVEKRQNEIRNILGTVDKLSVEELAERLHVTGATIRSDLRNMESRHEIYRSHGLVSLVRIHIQEQDIQDKIFINAEDKNTIGTEAAKLVAENDTLLMTSGTTIEAMARHIRPQGNLTVVTPSVSVALTMAHAKNVDVYMLGGHLHHNSLSTKDEYTLRGLENVTCNKMFLSCDGLDFGSGVVTATIEEARLTARMMASASRIILLADSSKFGKVGLGRICKISNIDVLVTDAGISESMLKRIEEAGVTVVIASEK